MTRITQALALLSEHQRQAIEMHYLEERPLAKVASVLHTTRAAVAGLLHRGLRALRSALGEE